MPIQPRTSPKKFDPRPPPLRQFIIHRPREQRQPRVRTPLLWRGKGASTRRIIRSRSVMLRLVTTSMHVAFVLLAAAAALRALPCPTSLYPPSVAAGEPRVLTARTAVRSDSPYLSALRRGRRVGQSHFGNVSRGIMPSTADGAIGPF